MNNISIGQYIPGTSWLHKLDPKYKILSLFVILTTIFLIPVRPDLFYVLLMSGFVFLAIGFIISSSIPIIKVLAGLRPILFLLTFTVIVQILYIRTGIPISEAITFHLSFSSIAALIVWFVFYQWTKKYVKFKTIYFLLSVVIVFGIQYVFNFGALYSYQVIIYDESLYRSAFIFLRIVNIIMLTSLLTFTTMTTDLNYGLEAVMKPLKWIKVPVDIITMMISLTLRYIPTLLEETDKIMKAQASRGVDFKESKFKEKVTQIISLLIPVFVISFKRSEDLANAMEVRGYVIGEPRTRIDEYKISHRDIISLFSSIVIMSMIIYLVYIK